MTFWTELRKSVMAMIVLTVLLGVLYPLLMTGIGKFAFGDQVNGSLVMNQQNQVVGSTLIGQSFQSPKYFMGRPSATSGSAYNGLASGGSNLSPANPQLTEVMNARIKALMQQNPWQTQLIPIDLITASGSGLDPDISPASAYYQAPRIAQLRGLSMATVNQLIKSNITYRQWGFLGEPRVNVLTLNLALDRTAKK